MIGLQLEADKWVRRVDIALPDDISAADRVALLRQVYRSGAIDLMDRLGHEVIQGEVPHDTRATLLTRTFSEHLQSKPITSEENYPDRYAIGVARDKKINILPAFLGGGAVELAKEEFYIRRLMNWPSDIAPDVSVDDWCIPYRDIKLPDNDDHLYANRWSVGRFGRRLAELAAGIGHVLPIEFDATDVS